jgi:hypothetical protein
MGTLKKHDEVMLHMEDTIVGYGTLQKVLPADIFGGVTLGMDRVVVLIEDAFDSDLDLPYPLENTRKLGDAKDKLVLWDIAQMHCHQEANPTLQSSPTSTTIGREIPTKTDQNQEGSKLNTIPILRPTSDEGDDGDEVYLYKCGSKVGQGIVHHIDPTKTCHNFIIGVGNISVRVLDVVEGCENEPLPFPHADCDTLGSQLVFQSYGLRYLCIKWGKQLLRVT